MKKGNPESLTERQHAELAALEAMADATIDTSDIPSTADLADGIRGAFFGPSTGKALARGADGERE